MKIRLLFVHVLAYFSAVKSTFNGNWSIVLESFVWNIRAYCCIFRLSTLQYDVLRHDIRHFRLIHHLRHQSHFDSTVERFPTLDLFQHIVSCHILQCIMSNLGAFLFAAISGGVQSGITSIWTGINCVVCCDSGVGRRLDNHEHFVLNCSPVYHRLSFLATDVTKIQNRKDLSNTDPERVLGNCQRRGSISYAVRPHDNTATYSCEQ